MEIINRVASLAHNLIRQHCFRSKKLNINERKAFHNFQSQQGMALIGVLAVMTLFAIALLAVAPTVQQGVQREKELESIRRGEEVADAIKQYVTFYRGGKLPNSMDDLLEGLPFGTKKRQILRPSAAIDPLSEDGKWRLVKFDSKSMVDFAQRVQAYNQGVLPANSNQFFDRYTPQLINVVDTGSDDDLKSDESSSEDATDNTPFIGVVSQNSDTSIIAYYGIENHSKWIFTPLFRGAGASNINTTGNSGSSSGTGRDANSKVKQP